MAEGLRETLLQPRQLRQRVQGLRLQAFRLDAARDAERALRLFRGGGELARRAMQAGQAQQAPGQRVLHVRIGGALARLLVRGLGCRHLPAPELEVAERNEARRDAALESDRPGQLECAPELPLGRDRVSQQQVQLPEPAQGLRQLGPGTDFLVHPQRSAVALQAEVVAPLLDECAGLRTQPIGPVLLHSGPVGQIDRVVEVPDRLVHLAQAQQAQRDVAVVLAHRRSGAQLLADLQRLPVVTERLAELAEQQVYTADVAEGVANAPREVRVGVKVQHALVLRERDVVVALLVEDEAQVVEAGAFQLPVAAHARHLAGLAEVGDGLVITALVPAEQAAHVERPALRQRIAGLALERQRTVQLAACLVEVAEAPVTLADVVQRGREVGPPPRPGEFCGQLLEPGQCLLGTVLAIHLGSRLDAWVEWRRARCQGRGQQRCRDQRPGEMLAPPPHACLNPGPGTERGGN